MLNYLSDIMHKVNEFIDTTNRNTEQRDLEHFLEDKNPSNAAEADMWIKIYHYEVEGRNTWL